MDGYWNYLIVPCGVLASLAPFAGIVIILLTSPSIRRSEAEVPEEGAKTGPGPVEFVAQPSPADLITRTQDPSLSVGQTPHQDQTGVSYGGVKSLDRLLD